MTPPPLTVLHFKYFCRFVLFSFFLCTFFCFCEFLTPFVSFLLRLLFDSRTYHCTKDAAAITCLAKCATHTHTHTHTVTHTQRECIWICVCNNDWKVSLCSCVQKFSACSCHKSRKYFGLAEAPPQKPLLLRHIYITKLHAVRPLNN